MNVILLERIRNQGNLGDIVKVKPGYARNYLFPKQMAIPASEANKTVFEARRAELEAKANGTMQAAEARKTQLQALGNITVSALASDEGKLYGSIGPNEIAKAITAAGHTVSKREVSMPEGPIHATGEYTIMVQFHSDVEAAVSVVIGSAK